MEKTKTGHITAQLKKEMMFRFRTCFMLKKWIIKQIKKPIKTIKDFRRTVLVKRLSMNCNCICDYYFFLQMIPSLVFSDKFPASAAQTLMLFEGNSSYLKIKFNSVRRVPRKKLMRVRESGGHSSGKALAVLLTT